MSVHSQFGKIGNERGRINEEKVFDAFSEECEEPPLPEWFRGYISATEEEDKRGIDGWVDTDVGKIKIQVKSSRNAAREFRKNNPDTAVISVRDGEDLETIRRRLLSEIDPLRKLYLEKRNQY